MGTILAVCKDVGGANSLLLVMDLLKRDYQIRWLAQENGRGKDVLQSLGYNFELYSSLNQISQDNVVAVVSSMCSTAGQDLAKRFKGYCPIVTIQDQWTNGLYDVWSDYKYRPDYVLVNDKLDKKFVLQAWPDFETNQVVTTGYPALDKYANLNVQLARTKVKNILSMVNNWPVILFTGQWWQTGHALTELVRSLNEIGQDIYLIARPHPAMKDNTPEEVPLWEKAIAEFKSGILVDSASFKNISDIIAGSDLVVSMYSATLQEAATLRIPNIAILYPDHGLKIYIEIAKSNEYPMVSLGCTAQAGNYEELSQLVKMALNSDMGLLLAQEKTFKLDGKNALRAAGFIYSLI